MTRLSGAERRQQIIRAAYEVMLEKGISDAATRDVTRKLNVGSGLLHHHFSSWGELRATAVETFVLAEIEDLERALEQTAAENLISRFVDWMADDPEYRHWRLWLDAIEEARRDPEMAKVIGGAYRSWHAVIIRLIERLVEERHGTSADPAASAWRLSALIDGLAGMAALGEVEVGADSAKRLLREQFGMELRSVI